MTSNSPTSDTNPSDHDSLHHDVQEIETKLALSHLTDEHVEGAQTHDQAADVQVLPSFDWRSYSTDKYNVQLHLCEDRGSFEDALQLLKGEHVLGFDVEHKPFGKQRGSQDNEEEESEESKAFNEAANSAFEDLLQVFKTTAPENLPEIKKKHGLVSGLEWTDGTYKRSTIYTKAALSVIQLASPTHIVLGHIALFETDTALINLDQLVPPTLKELLEDTNIVKVGRAVHGDGSDSADCSRYLDINCQSLLELHDIHDLIDAQQNSKVSLRTLCEIYLQRTMAGKGTVTCSEWHLPRRLSEAQIEYAANDAMAGLVLYNTMMSRLTALGLNRPALFNQKPFDFAKHLQMRIERAKASTTKSARRRLRLLGVAGVAPEKKWDRSGDASVTDQKTADRRSKMSEEDRELAEELSDLRNEILVNEKEAKDVNSKTYHWVVKDDVIDKMVTQKLSTKEELMDIVKGGKAKSNFEPYVERFLEVINDFRSLEAEEEQTEDVEED